MPGILPLPHVYCRVLLNLLNVPHLQTDSNELCRLQTGHVLPDVLVKVTQRGKFSWRMLSRPTDPSHHRRREREKVKKNPCHGWSIFGVVEITLVLQGQALTRISTVQSPDISQINNHHKIDSRRPPDWSHLWLLTAFYKLLCKVQPSNMGWIAFNVLRQ